MQGNIYIVTHKETDMPIAQGYVPLFVGAYAYPEGKTGYLADNVGINISEKNKSYCELTGLYWIWKNVKSDFVGLVHYRRFFINVTSPTLIKTRSLKVLLRSNGYKLLSVAEVQHLLQNTDMIVREFKVDSSVFSFFAKTVGEGIIRDLIQCVPFEEREALTRYIQGNTFVCCNMFIGKKEIIDKYCEWLFPILDKADVLKEKATGERYCNRELGYLGEILFGFYLSSRKIKCIEKPVLDCGKVSGTVTLWKFIKLSGAYIMDRIRRIME